MVTPGSRGMRHGVSEEGQAGVQLFPSEFFHFMFSDG